MAIATRYQNMKPDEIVKHQSEMMAMTQAQTEFQQSASEFETSFNELESDFRSAFGKRLGAIESEYRKLPDGEGTPQLAIKKGEELMASYNKEYEAICHEYFTSSDAKFKNWLKDFNTFLNEKEIPFNQKMIKMQYAQYGITATNLLPTLWQLRGIWKNAQRYSAFGGLILRGSWTHAKFGGRCSCCRCHVTTSARPHTSHYLLLTTYNYT